MRVIWTARAKSEFRKTLSYINQEFGKKTAMEFAEKVDQWVVWMSENPEISPQEQLLADRTILYRSRKVGKYNKLIFKNNSTTLFIVDLWDMRRKPARLAARIRSQKKTIKNDNTTKT